MKSTSLDADQNQIDNLGMNKKEIIKTWQQGEKFDEEGYGDLAFTLKTNALEELRKLPKQEKLQVVDIIMPIIKNDGN